MRSAVNAICQAVWDPNGFDQDNIVTYLADLFKIFDQELRTPAERQEILKTDIQDLLNLYAGTIEDEEGYTNETREWLQDLICAHLIQTARIGTKLSDTDLLVLLKPAEFSSRPDFSDTSLAEYYPCLNNTPDTIAKDQDKLPTPGGTDKEKKYFQAVIRENMLAPKEQYYIWESEKRYLGYFVAKLYPGRSPENLDLWFSTKHVAKYKADAVEDLKHRDDKAEKERINKKYKAIRIVLKQCSVEAKST